MPQEPLEAMQPLQPRQQVAVGIVTNSRAVPARQARAGNARDWVSVRDLHYGDGE
ncbi:hypothetical protein BN874_1370008 [Candidatus Contendobacter odensis Run_B_J11]|uniref:Uncharacterized protein n=1 Tax=Candidatus Contendobacter odensis Run_B_J11 TaxID=1400861 RepID=A0A7U7J346_9GAMM|nr:hypothetical protein BN874_1370008 [Candidatus Contendobacter odensis Run_B_J11]